MSTLRYNSISTTALSNVPISIHGLNLPHRVRVLSTIYPIAVSLTASHILATAKSTPTKAASTSLTSVRYFIRKVDTMAYTKSLPNAPSPKLSFERHESFSSIISSSFLITPLLLAKKPFLKYRLRHFAISVLLLTGFIILPLSVNVNTEF